MKRLLPLVLAMALALSGCNRTTSVPGTDPKNNLPAARTDAPPASTLSTAFTPETRSLVSPDEVPLLEQINRENIKVVSAALPGIVRITATRSVDPRMSFFGNNLPFQFHFGPGASRPSPQNEPAFGSGVIISRDGYIVTNYHVIEDANTVEVQLQDKRIFSARVIASDAPVDVAVLKIEAADLTALPWGDSDKVQVGEQVFAIGNPFNLDDSVSRGIVSAKGRSLEGASNYQDYIQTDAAINPGNSGGALINIQGKLIGINAAIASTSRVNMGVGFAIPSNLVRYALEGLLKEGKVVRGYLGVKLPEMIDEGVMAQLGLNTDQGALLAGVLRNSPADQAGLHPGDFITEVDGHKISGVDNLRLVVAQLPIGKDVKLAYIRDGTAQSTMVKIAELPRDGRSGFNRGEENDNGEQPSPAPDDGQTRVENVLGGIQVADLNDKVRQQYEVDKGVTAGVVVSTVREGSLAEAKGMLPGDVIESACVNRGSTQEISAAKDFIDLTKNMKAGQSVVLLVHHGKTSSFIYFASPK